MKITLDAPKVIPGMENKAISSPSGIPQASQTKIVLDPPPTPKSTEFFGGDWSPTHNALTEKVGNYFPSIKDGQFKPGDVLDGYYKAGD